MQKTLQRLPYTRRLRLLSREVTLTIVLTILALALITSTRHAQNGISNAPHAPDRTVSVGATKDLH